MGSILLEQLTRAGVGAGSLSLLLFLLGRAGAFRPSVLVALTAVLAVPGLWSLLLAARRVRLPRALPGIAVALAGLTVLALVLDLVGAATPPTSVDALAYHVEIPHFWLQQGRIGDPFWNYAAFYPLGVEMLFAQGLALHSGATASAEHAILGVLAALAVYGLAKELGGRRPVAGVLGAALFVLQGTFTWDATSAFIELGLAFYTVLAVWLAVRYAANPTRGGAVLVGLVAGAVASAKSVGLVVVLLLVIPICALALRRRRPADAAFAVSSTVLLGSYWYLRNWIVADNPVYPLIFGGKDFTTGFEDYLRGLPLIYPGTHGSDPLRILILPLDLLLHGSRFDRGQYVGIGIFFFGAAGAWLLRRNRVAAAVSSLVGVYVVVWWYLVPQVRYLLPALGVLAALGGAGLARHLEQSGRVRTLLAVALVLVAIDWAVPSLALERQLFPVAVGAESRAAFVQRLVGTYDAFQAIERRVGPTPVVAFATYRWPYWYPGRAIWWGWPEFMGDVPVPEILRRLRQEHVKYIVSWGAFYERPAVTRCMRRIASYRAEYVMSRTRGESRPIRLILYSARGCYR